MEIGIRMITVVVIIKAMKIIISMISVVV